MTQEELRILAECSAEKNWIGWGDRSGWVCGFIEGYLKCEEDQKAKQNEIAAKVDDPRLSGWIKT